MREVIFSNGCRVDADHVRSVRRCSAGDTMILCADRDSVFVTESVDWVELMIRQAKSQRQDDLKPLAPVGRAPFDEDTQVIL